MTGYEYYLKLMELGEMEPQSGKEISEEIKRILEEYDSKLENGEFKNELECCDAKITLLKYVTEIVQIRKASLIYEGRRNR